MSYNKEYHKYRPRTYKYKGYEIHRSEGCYPSFSVEFNSDERAVFKKLWKIKKVIDIYECVNAAGEDLRTSKKEVGDEQY